MVQNTDMSQVLRSGRDGGRMHFKKNTVGLCREDFNENIHACSQDKMTQLNFKMNLLPGPNRRMSDPNGSKD